MSCKATTRIIQVTSALPDGVIVSGVYNPGTETITFTNSEGGTFDVTGITADTSLYAGDGQLAGAPTLYTAAFDAGNQVGSARANLIVLPTPVVFAADVLLAPRTLTEVGEYSDSRVGLRLRRQVGTAITGISI